MSGADHMLQASSQCTAFSCSPESFQVPCWLHPYLQARLLPHTPHRSSAFCPTLLPTNPERLTPTEPSHQPSQTLPLLNKTVNSNTVISAWHCYLPPLFSSTAFVQLTLKVYHVSGTSALGISRQMRWCHGLPIL